MRNLLDVEGDQTWRMRHLFCLTDRAGSGYNYFTAGPRRRFRSLTKVWSGTESLSHLEEEHHCGVLIAQSLSDSL